MGKKYKFTGETREFEGHLLRRIQYLRHVGVKKKGSLGGWIESEDNLSHEGECLVIEEAKVFGNARIMNDAMVRWFSIVKDNAQILENASIDKNTIVGADTIVDSKSNITGKSKIYFYADKDYGRLPNVSGESVILNSNIEGTGVIHDCYIKGQSISGDISLFFEDIKDIKDITDSNS